MTTVSRARRERGPVSAAWLDICPECGGERLEPVADGETAKFFCPDCALCWRLDMGWVSRVDPGTCPGCDHRSTCLLAGRSYGAASTGPESMAARHEVGERTAR